MTFSAYPIQVMSGFPVGLQNSVIALSFSAHPILFFFRDESRVVGPSRDTAVLEIAGV